MADEPDGMPLSDVLKVAHHGAAASTSVWQIASVSPSLAVIQVGRNNSYGHPHPETLARLEDAGIAVLRNDLDGAVRVRVLKSGDVIAQTWADFR